MVQVSFSNHFKKTLKKKVKKDPVLHEIFFQKLKLFSLNPFHPSLKTHILTGELDGLHSFSVGYDVRVVFISSVNQKLPLKILAHDEVY